MDIIRIIPLRERNARIVASFLHHYCAQNSIGFNSIGRYSSSHRIAMMQRDNKREKKKPLFLT